MEQEVVVSAVVGFVLFLVLLLVVWRVQAGRSLAPRGAPSPGEGVVTVTMPTAPEPALMVLSHANGEEESPTGAAIAAALNALSTDSDDTVTLDDPDGSGSYMQTYLEAENSYVLEYYEGGTYRQFRADPNPDTPTALTLFTLFSRRDWEGLKGAAAWRDIGTL